jgi:hypothetical protein
MQKKPYTSVYSVSLKVLKHVSIFGINLIERFVSHYKMFVLVYLSYRLILTFKHASSLSISLSHTRARAHTHTHTHTHTPSPHGSINVSQTI